MVYVENNKYVFFNHKASFSKKENGVTKDIVMYTNNPGRVEVMVNKYSDIMSNFKTEQLKPTVEQYKRLEEINDLAIDNKESRVMDANNYIEYGIVINNDKAFETLFDKAKEVTKEHIINLLKPIIKECRNKLEDEGYLFKDKLFDCDSAARANMAGTVAAMAAESLMGKTKEEILNAKLVWKLYDNTYFEISAGDVITLGNEVKSYFADSIYAENLTIEVLKTKTVHELLAIEELVELRSLLRNDSGEELVSVYNIYKETLKNFRANKDK